MDTPERRKVRGSYDDNVLARTPVELGFNSDCTNLMMSLNMMSLGVGVVQAAADSKKGAQAAVGVQAAMGVAQTAIMLGSMLETGISLASSTADLATAVAGLAVASAGCAILIGCAAIPQWTAAIIFTSAAIVASVAALAITAAAFVPQLIYVAATIAVGITAGVGVSQTIDLADLRRQAQEAHATARQNKDDTQAEYDKLVNNAALSRARRDAAQAALTTTARNIITQTNALGVPPGTAPLTAMDGQITAFLNAVEAKNVADFNVEQSKVDVFNAGRELDAARDARQQGYNDTLAFPTDMSYADRYVELQRYYNEKENAYLAAVAARDAAPAAATTATNNAANATAALISASNRSYCVASNCSLVYSGGASMNLAILEFLSADDSYAPKAKRIAAARLALDKAIEAEAKALDALNQINALNTGAPPTGSELFIWAGAEAILKAADAKGGSK